MFYCKNNLLPLLFLNLFVTNSQIHNNGTRTANNIKHICAVQISSNLFSTKVLKFGTLFLFQSLAHQTFFSLQKCKSFYWNNHWIGQAAHLQHFFFTWFIIIVSEVALS